MLTVVSILLVVFVVMVFRYLNEEHRPPILGIYQQKNKNYWFKFVFMYVLLNFKLLVRHVKRIIAVERGDNEGTSHIQKQDEQLEDKHDLGDFPMAVDAVYFNAMSQSGAALLCNVARHQKGQCDAFFMLKLEDQELLLSRSLPDTCLQHKPEEEGFYKIDGLTLEMFVPMRAWKIQYDGLLKPRNNPDKQVPVKLSLVWSTPFQHFDYDAISPLSMARDMARENWSRDYFRQLKKNHQRHYEQAGFIQGTATVDGKDYELNMPCIRDHSFGKLRNWRNFHRYAYHFVHLENGDSLAVGCVSQPLLLSHLTIGYYCRRADHEVFTIDGSSFKLYEHGENEVLPKDYAFTFNCDGQNFTMQVLVKDEEIFYIGKEREAKFYERWGSVDVNGVKGWLCAEWYYNNHKESVK